MGGCDRGNGQVFELRFTAEARGDLKALRKHEQAEVLGAVETQLIHEPTSETRNRKRLRPNETADWELRAGNLRVLYNVDQGSRLVRIEAIGIKVGNHLLIRGRRTQL